MTAYDLDTLRERLDAWTASLWQPLGEGVGGYATAPAGPVNLMSSTDVAWIRYALGHDDVGGARREAWVRWLQSRQDPVTGRFEYEPHARPRHSSGHAFWHVVRALHLLQADLLHFPRYLGPVTTVEGLEAFFDAVDWAGPASNHHEVLGLVPILVSLAGPEWTETFFRKLGEQQDPARGTWPRGDRVDISRTFAYTTLHLATGRMPNGPERIVDAMLALQTRDGVWDAGPGFLTMDAAYLLVRLPGRVGHRQADAEAALGRLREAMGRLTSGSAEWFSDGTHAALARVVTLALLAEAFPQMQARARPWRFGWDQPAMYHSATIAKGAP